MTPQDLKITQIKKSGNFGTFLMEPLPTGFGHTLGNSLRRVLLSQLHGAAVFQVKIEGVSHPFSTLPGVREDMVELILNIKRISLRIIGEDPVIMKLEVKGPRKITAADINTPAEVEIVNKDLIIAHLADKKTKLSMEIAAEPGKGFIAADERPTSKIGAIPVDSIFSPVLEVSYKVGSARVGQITNLDSLTLNITTDGTITPKEALKQASTLLVDFFQRIFYGEEKNIDVEAKKDKEKKKRVTAKDKKIPVDDLDLPIRVINRLTKEKIKTLGDLLEKSEDDLLAIKNLGVKSVKQILKAVEKEGFA